jgi:hypothetical protein
VKRERNDPNNVCTYEYMNKEKKRTNKKNLKITEREQQRE